MKKKDWWRSCCRSELFRHVFVAFREESLNFKGNVMGKKKVTSVQRQAQEAKRARISQNDLPKLTINNALRLAQSLLNDFAGKSAPPHQLAMSVGLSPTSSTWRDICGASIGYGLTDGGYNANSISLTELGKRIVDPEIEIGGIAAKAEAVLRPRICQTFFQKYNRAKFPSDKIAENVLITMGVPKDRATSTVELLKHNGEVAGIIHQTKTGPFIAIEDPRPVIKTDVDDEPTILTEEEQLSSSDAIDNSSKSTTFIRQNIEQSRNRVFISHGKDRSITQQIKEILTFGKFEAVVSVEKESTAIPVPDKVFQDMRSCAAAVIHVVSEGESLSPNGDKVHRLNENVLIEIGAAIALCGKNVVLLVEKGTPLPSNLQGLYRCEYEGDKLDYEATMKLLKTFNEFKMD